MIVFFGLLFGLLALGIFLCVQGLRDKTPRRPLRPHEQLYIDMQFLQDRQNAVEEDRRMSDRMRNY